MSGGVPPPGPGRPRRPATGPCSPGRGGTLWLMAKDWHDPSRRGPRRAAWQTAAPPTVTADRPRLRTVARPDGDVASSAGIALVSVRYLAGRTWRWRSQLPVPVAWDERVRITPAAVGAADVWPRSGRGTPCLHAAGAAV